MNNTYSNWISKNIDGVSAYQYFQLIRFSVTLLIGIALVKSSMPLQEVAIYEILLFLCNFISFSWSLGFKNGFLAYFNNDEMKKDALAFHFFIILILFSVLFSGFFYVFSDYIIGLFVSYEVPFVGLMLIYLLINIPTLIIENVYILYEKEKELISYATWVFTLQLILILISLFVFGEVQYLMYALIFWAFIKLLWTLKVLNQYSSWHFDRELFLLFFSFSLPLVFHMLMSNAIEYVDGFLVTKYFDEETFVVYRYGARELPYVLLIIGAMTSVLVPRAVKDLIKTLHETKLRVGKLMNWMYPLTILLVLISPLIFPIVYDSNFKDSAYLLNIYALILASRILLPQLVLWGKHLRKELLLFTGIELVLNVVLSIILLKKYGIYGIAAGSVIAFFIGKAIMICHNYIRFQITPGMYIPIKKYLIYTFLLIIAFALSLQY